jgi:hypothetical protein
MGGACGVQEEPGKQHRRSCRAQELARSSAQENERQKKGLAQSAELLLRQDTGHRREGIELAPDKLNHEIERELPSLTREVQVEALPGSGWYSCSNEVR